MGARGAMHALRMYVSSRLTGVRAVQLCQGLLTAGLLWQWSEELLRVTAV